MLDKSLTIDPVEFEVTDHETAWVPDNSSDIGGTDGYYACTILKATVHDFDGDSYEVDRDYLMTAFSPQMVWNAEQRLAEEMQ